MRVSVPTSAGVELVAGLGGAIVCMIVLPRVRGGANRVPRPEPLTLDLPGSRSQFGVAIMHRSRELLKDFRNPCPNRVPVTLYWVAGAILALQLGTVHFGGVTNA